MSKPSDADSLSPIPLIPRPPVIGFVARRDKDGHDIVELLKEELAPGKNQLLSLWGPGGIGKTTLAAEAARALSESYKQRIVWVSADGRADFTFSTFLDEIARQLNHDDALRLAIEPKTAEVQALISSAPTLVVLDNFETISNDEGKRCAEFLGQKSPHPALITTRQRVEGAYNILIDAMSPEEAREFLERLIQQSPDPQVFTPSMRERIIQTAAANPLVMQWIVAQVDLAMSLDDVLDDLAHGAGDAAQRVFDRSFDLSQLTDDGRAALLALSLFVPSASRLALAEVAGFGSDEKRLNEAVKRMAALRLVNTTDGGERLIIQGLIRELAKVRLMKDEHADEYRQRLVSYFLNYAEAHTQPTPEDWDALETEKDNLLNAMDIAFELRDWMSVIQLMDAINCDGVNGLLMVRGYWDEAIRRGKQALNVARNLSAENQIARFAHNLAITYQLRGELEEARRLYSESLEITKELANRSGIAANLHQLGRLAQDQGELEEARQLYNESLEINKKLSSQRGIANTLHNLAAIAQDQGELEEARRLYSESLEIKKRLGDQNGIAITLHELGRLAQAQEELEEARRLYNESLEIAKMLGNQSSIATALHELGGLAQAHGKSEEARRLYSESLEIKKRLGDQNGIAITLSQLGRLAVDEGDIAEAARMFREALSIFEKLRSPYAEIVRLDLNNLEANRAS
ncbi:MAG: hypothetical protein AUG51_09960 [Acidobacteria bacterium 13_1_20CM_3_53_8]|nr:MAG: hypothetical protein AUG51_09960 [Acidobacteria bacterium 13_1_20CM_3_53_8]